MPTTTLERRLGAIVGTAHVLNDPEVCASYGRDRVVRRLAGLLNDNAAYVVAECAASTDPVHELVGEFGGSISAEHGVGVAKRRWLHLARSPDEIGMMAAVKDAFDPRGILKLGRAVA